MNLENYVSFEIYVCFLVIFFGGTWLYMLRTSRDNMKELFQLERDYINKPVDSNKKEES